MIMTESSVYGNTRRHLTSEHSYAHFSGIDTNNYMITPSLLLTSPQRFTLSPGESLWIPRGWWHWIRTNGPAVAVNLWMPHSIGSSRVPYVLTDFSHPSSLLTAIDGVKTKPDVWNSNIDTMIRNSTLKRDNEYTITLSGYKKQDIFDPLNKELLRVANTHAYVPPGAKVNVWMSEGYHDTGLHYDDNDGILSVLRGTKEITMFPPSDTPYLRPHSVLPSWATQRPAKVFYNLYKFSHYLPNTSLPSARLLYESIQNKAVIREITKMYRETTAPLVWGCKLEKGVMRWEIYAYHYHINNVLKSNGALVTFRSPQPVDCVIHSIDLFDREDPVGPDIHYYYKDSPGIYFPIEGHGTTGLTHLESEFRIDTSSSMIDHFNKYAKEIGFCDKDITKCVGLLRQYDCKQIAIWNKYKHQFYIQYYGISKQDFLHFLRQHNYPKSFIAHVSTGEYADIEHEITIVYDLDTLEPVRSGFYGIL